MGKAENMGVCYSLLWALPLVIGKALIEGAWKTVHASWEALNLITDNNHLYGVLCCKIVLELKSLCYLLDASPSPREVRQCEETGSELRQ